VAQDEDGAVLGPEPAEAPLERVTIHHGGGGIRRRHDLANLDHSRRPPSLAIRLAIDGPDEDAMEPGIKAVGVAQSLQITPGEDERLLDRVVGLVAVPEHELGDVEEPADGAGGERRERLPIAPSRYLDQLSLHHSPLVPGRMRRLLH
jgi:hypothetical protein